MKPAFSVVMLLLASCLAMPLQAEPYKMRPGLWEHSFTIKSQSGEMESAMANMQQQLANMPPEQRKRMEQMMAAQGVQAGAGGQSIRVCVSEEQAERSMMPQQDGDCRQEVLERRGNTIKYRFQCSGDAPSSGEGEVTFTSPTSYSGTSTINTTVQGRTETMAMAQSGKWLSSDCGNLKPR